MKKGLKIFFPIFFIAILLGTTTVRGDYNVAVGNTFNYDVVKSSWNITFGTNTSQGTGFNFKDVKYPVGTQFTVEVTAVSPASSVSWDMTVGTETESGTNTLLDVIGIAISLFLPVFLAGGVSGTWNQTEIDLGPEIWSLFFLEPVSFSDFFYMLSNETYVTESMSDTHFEFNNVYGAFDNSSTIAIFEWHFDITYTDTDADYGGTYTFKIAFDKNTGQVKGQYFAFDYAGTIEGNTFNYKYTQLVEDENYNMPGVGFIPGFEWFITLPVLVLLGSIAVIVRRRK
ncbi:MAG: hypothetical protein K9W42_08635 [Candidatus Heimdallarchaeota archaeon]|nr:hypothetical protein [Candidatus Heimdallarchaeota archaeon]